MSRSPRSLEQPLVLYALVFIAAACVLVLTLATRGTVEAAKRAYRRSVEAELQRLARLPEPTLREVMKREAEGELAVSLVDVTHGPELLHRARSSTERQVSVKVPRTTAETYLVAELDPGIPTTIAFSEITQLVPWVIVGALAIAAFFVFLTSRLVIRPLDTLAAAADTEDFDEEALRTDRLDPPNEIIDVALRFRRTVKRLRDEQATIASQRDALLAMQESLVRASKLASVGRLAAGIAHEVGNPLAAVKGYLGLMKSGLDGDERRDAVDRSLREVTRIHDTISKLLTYARSGEMGAEPLTAASLSGVFGEAWSLARGHPSLRQVRLEQTVPARAQVMCHPERLGQVFVNLLLNAGQAMKGAPETPAISLETHRVDGFWEVRVRDRGPGIAEDVAREIFDPFFTTKAPGEGTGLGLPVSRAMMEAMGGDLTFESSAPGATFVLRLEAADLDPRLTAE